ncbi:hypothetical protein PN465_10970 [Nodularia spumigena CS-584]|jgi:hypothetical protein|uniref:Flagellar assembly protein H n=1 Tax=Nodularia spumigena UHCC 0060 TaxID=3110300 RepID=A0ABU5UXI7_NODSP|nr:hypothetical protein [Nodularia spumigena]AHJ28557.1 hypothetical protein NSP_22250 [Nodularia spumigena CCY9414]EAW44642.1 hypothetical protein N9414_06234 [Nodularia spumigena CCY9414]MDB9382739.1 hypothetical protein [Nodularia spumigena CS-584]MEA5527812.1 hypothetical protein [Nodularia spumigena UHCC 0143]MEA5557177.1 hypothetical protein [Nodularia spumigena CH309]
MTRKPHDQFAKQFLEELLSPLGKVEPNKEVIDEARQVDVLFSPAPTAQAPNLGLLGRIALLNTALLEPFRNQPSRTEIRNCLTKLFTVIADSQRKAKREDTTISEDDLARLWILAPSASPGLLESFGAKLELETWLPGVYFLPDAFRTAILAINELPVTEETLWFRLLGRGKVQQQAVSELVALSPENLLRRNVLEIIYRWRVSIMTQQKLTEDDQELIMNLTEAYQEARAAAVQEGVEQGQRQVIENLLKYRFGSVDEELSRVVDSLLRLPPEEFTPFCLQLTREELLNRFGRTGQ